MAESIMLDKAKDFAVEIINICKQIKETKREFNLAVLKKQFSYRTEWDNLALQLVAKFS